MDYATIVYLYVAHQIGAFLHSSRLSKTSKCLSAYFCYVRHFDSAQFVFGVMDGYAYRYATKFTHFTNILILMVLINAGSTFGIQDSILGLTFLAAGGCLPEAISITITSRKGKFTTHYF